MFLKKKKNILFTLKRPFHLMVAIMKHRANKLPSKIKAILATVSDKKTPKLLSAVICGRQMNTV